MSKRHWWFSDKWVPPLPPLQTPPPPTETELRTWALQMAVDRTPVGDFTDDTVKRAAAFLKFLKGDQS